MELLEQARRQKSGVVSTQVLQQYFAAATRKLRVPAATARGKVEFFSRLNLIQIALPDILAAIDIYRLHSSSFWYGLILAAAAAIRAGCSIGPVAADTGCFSPADPTATRVEPRSSPKKANFGKSGRATRIGRQGRWHAEHRTGLRG